MEQVIYGGRGRDGEGKKWGEKMGESIVFYAAQLNKFVHVKKKLRKKGKMKKV